MKIRLSSRAFHHLESIHSYISKDKPDAAANVIDRILNAIGQLGIHPQLGRVGRRKGTRELVQPPFVIVYRVLEETISIEAVLHGNQKYG